MPEFHWLEDIESERALAWVHERNEHSLSRLTKDPRYEPLHHAAVEYLTAQDRIPYATAAGGRIHNFWQDRDHVKGIWRTTSLDRYAGTDPDWQTILDIDALAEEEQEDWVYKGRTSLGPDFDRCLVHLSRGGSDAMEIREFDIPSGNFVTGGFFIAEAKTRVD
ncbi:MAG TPA: S9 family peptidase, partial [Pseudomonadales bacterium]|nr:S9 family peptidase [Pseudomonadales bacterium]